VTAAEVGLEPDGGIVVAGLLIETVGIEPLDAVSRYN
jgi:hypothetical protein